MEEMGVVSWGANYLYGRFDDAKVSDYAMPRFAKKFPEVGKALIGMDTWRVMGSHDFMWIGEVFGTPVTDGQALYVATAWGVYASYDLDGKARWMRVLSPERPHDYCSVGRSPLLRGDLLISDIGRMVRVFDRNSGKLEWQALNAAKVTLEPGIGAVPVAGEHRMVLNGPAVFTLTAEGPGGPSVRTRRQGSRDRQPPGPTPRVHEIEVLSVHPPQRTGLQNAKEIVYCKL